MWFVSKMAGITKYVYRDWRRTVSMCRRSSELWGCRRRREDRGRARLKHPEKLRKKQRMLPLRKIYSTVVPFHLFQYQWPRLRFARILLYHVRTVSSRNTGIHTKDQEKFAPSENFCAAHNPWNWRNRWHVWDTPYLYPTPRTANQKRLSAWILWNISTGSRRSGSAHICKEKSNMISELLQTLSMEDQDSQTPECLSTVLCSFLHLSLSHFGSNSAIWCEASMSSMGKGHTKTCANDWYTQGCTCSGRPFGRLGQRRQVIYTKSVLTRICGYL